jgi:hypothetical protein
MGMDKTYWGSNIPDLFDHVNRHVEKDARIFILGECPMHYDVFFQRDYQSFAATALHHPRLREDLRVFPAELLLVLANVSGPAYLVVNHRVFGTEILSQMQHLQLTQIAASTYQGVTICSLHRIQTAPDSNVAPPGSPQGLERREIESVTLTEVENQGARETAIRYRIRIGAEGVFPRVCVEWETPDGGMARSAIHDLDAAIPPRAREAIDPQRTRLWHGGDVLSFEWRPFRELLTKDTIVRLITGPEEKRQLVWCNR